jgi:hypothetical protein
VGKEIATLLPFGTDWCQRTDSGQENQVVFRILLK